jgi:hypothetical protein
VSIVTIANENLLEPSEDHQPNLDASEIPEVPVTPRGWSATLQQVVIILAERSPWILTAVATLLHHGSI